MTALQQAEVASTGLPVSRLTALPVRRFVRQPVERACVLVEVQALAMAVKTMQQILADYVRIYSARD